MNLILFAVFAACACFVNGQTKSCETASGGSGECISIFNCPVLLQALERVNSGKHTNEDLSLLKRSKCGFQGSSPAVCCPKETEPIQLPPGGCYTPEGSVGRCIGLYSCPHLVHLLNPPILDKNKEYIKKSICQGEEPLSVCCGPPPSPNRDRDPTDTSSGCAAQVSAYPPDPSTECCGVDSRVGNKIVGGTATTVDQYPWLSIIKYKLIGQTKRLQCGGALISGRYILTAAHCVTGNILAKGTPTAVTLGEYDTSNDGGPDCVTVDGGGTDCTEGITTIPIEKTIPHPQYNVHNKHNDIALIRLAQDAPFTEFIRPICLPTKDLTEPQNVPNNFTLFVAGWGAISDYISFSKVKLHVDLPYVDLENCQPHYTKPGRRVTLWKAQMCAGGVSDKDSCRGDSGGPLMYEDGRTFHALGVVSFGPQHCGETDVPGVYSKVYEYLDWIRSNIVP